MPRKIETLFSDCHQAVVCEETGTCTRCRQWVENPIPESELEPEEDIEYLS
jgi:hypothetical protein